MPTQRKTDKQGPYFQWGDSGKKYRYTPNDPESREKARELANLQGRAIKASEGRRKYN